MPERLKTCNATIHANGETEMIVRNTIKTFTFAAGALIAVAAFTPAANADVSAVIGAASLPATDTTAGGDNARALDLPRNYSAQVGLHPQAPQAGAEGQIAPAGNALQAGDQPRTYSAAIGSGPWQ